VSQHTCLQRNFSILWRKSIPSFAKFEKLDTSTHNDTARDTIYAHLSLSLQSTLLHVINPPLKVHAAAAAHSLRQWSVMMIPPTLHTYTIHHQTHTSSLTCPRKRRPRELVTTHLRSTIRDDGGCFSFWLWLSRGRRNCCPLLSSISFNLLDSRQGGVSKGKDLVKQKKRWFIYLDSVLTSNSCTNWAFADET